MYASMASKKKKKSCAATTAMFVWNLVENEQFSVQLSGNGISYCIVIGCGTKATTNAFFFIQHNYFLNRRGNFIRVTEAYNFFLQRAK